MYLSRSSYAPAHDHIADCADKTQSDRPTSIVDSSGSFGERALGAQSKMLLGHRLLSFGRTVIRAYASTRLSLVAIAPNNIFHRLTHAEFLETLFVCVRRS